MKLPLSSTYHLYLRIRWTNSFNCRKAVGFRGRR